MPKEHLPETQKKKTVDHPLVYSQDFYTSTRFFFFSSSEAKTTSSRHTRLTHPSTSDIIPDHMTRPLLRAEARAVN